MTQHTPYCQNNEVSAENCSCGDDGCTKTTRQYADISVPLELKPDASLGDVSVECYGEPTVVCRENRYNNSCKITVNQKIALIIPIHYEVDVSMGKSDINCYGNTPCCR
ncbi:MAG: hypothetical protein ACI4HO_00075 [Ruminococcus sp.]